MSAVFALDAVLALRKVWDGANLKLYAHHVIKEDTKEIT
jgi:hypothetical protein